MKQIEKEQKAENTSVYVSEVEKESVLLLKSVEEAKTEMNDYYLRLLDGECDKGEAEEKVNSLRRAAANIIKALGQVCAVSDELSSRCSDAKKQKNIMTAPANSEIDLRESVTNHFAKGLNAYKLMLVCFIGSFMGVIVEMLWCLLVNKRLESRAGLVYGPFNLLYGIGAVVLTVCLYKFRNRSGWISFVGGMLVGSVIEYACSWGQELIFGSRSWDYSTMPLNINGRICFLYSLFWGFLGVMWIKNIYPRIAERILKIPNKAGKIITWALTVFLAVNAAVSLAAAYRWTERIDNIPPSNALEEVLDKHFPNERMERVYSNMEFK